jgi:hypothetical protein
LAWLCLAWLCWAWVCSAPPCCTRNPASSTKHCRASSLIDASHAFQQTWWVMGTREVCDVVSIGVVWYGVVSYQYRRTLVMESDREWAMESDCILIHLIRKCHIRSHQKAHHLFRDKTLPDASIPRGRWFGR